MAIAELIKQDFVVFGPNVWIVAQDGQLLKNPFKDARGLRIEEEGQLLSSLAANRETP